MICERGQTVTGLLKIHEATKISIQSIRTSMIILTTVGFLTSKTTNKFRLISICKYNDYQSEPTSKPTIHQQSTNNPLTTNKNDKNVKNEKKEETTTTEAACAAVGVSGVNGQGGGDAEPVRGEGEAKEGAGESKAVNWENCKTDIQRVVAHYVKITTPHLYAPGACTQSQATAIFKVQGKAVAPLIAQCGDVPTTCRVIDLAAKYYHGRGLDWSLHAVSKSCTDYLNQIAKEKSYGKK